MKLAKEKNVTVLLDGQGADETIAGYYKYFTPFLMELYKSGKKGYQTQLDAIDKNLGENYALSKSQSLYTKMPSVHSAVSNLIRPLTLKNSVTDISEDFYQNYRKESSPFKHFDNLDKSLYFDTFQYGLGKLLRFADRNSMAFSREVRLPYLSHKLVEFVFSLPKEYKISEGWSKYVLRLGLENILPKEIAWRKDKKGFQAPAKWMNDKKVGDLTETSIEFLKARKYIETPDAKNAWKYIMIYSALTV